MTGRAILLKPVLVLLDICFDLRPENILQHVEVLVLVQPGSLLKPVDDDAPVNDGCKSHNLTTSLNPDLFKHLWIIALWSPITLILAIWATSLFKDFLICVDDFLAQILVLVEKPIAVKNTPAFVLLSQSGDCVAPERKKF